MVRPLPLVVALLLVLPACSSEPAPPAEQPRAEQAPSDVPRAERPRTPSPRPRASQPADPPAPEPVLDDWVVGAEPLPLRDDGFGRVLPTPAELRVRRMRTEDVLPPPAGPGFDAVQRPVTPALARRTDLAWFPGCPVELAELRLVELSFWGFDDRPHTGQLVVNETVADDVVSVFRSLHAARFPIEEMRLVTRADLDAPPTGDGNTTAAYACRPVTGSTGWSAHAYGLAIDVNPFNNPYRNDDLVLPELASSYLDRGWRRPGMIFDGGPVVRAFESVGWTWGGDFRSVLDLHHFSANWR
jgi:D-alanyl-D-alanine carboxypeptidase